MKKIKKVCSYCSHPAFRNSLLHRLLIRLYRLLGYKLSHGICERCAEKYWS